MGVPAVHSFMSENIMAEKHKKNVNRNKHWQRYIHWDGKYAVNRPYPAYSYPDVVFSERVDKMHVLPSKYPYVTPF